MRKEPIIAIVLGSLVGVVVAFGVWRYTQTVKNNKPSEFANSNEVISDIKDNPLVSQDFSLLKPIDNSVITDSELIISGLADSNALIVIINNSKIIFTNANEKGEFEEAIEANGGYNNLEVYSFANNKKSLQKTNVVYSNQVEVPVDGKLTLMTGTVTDISEKAIQIKTTEDIIEQISTNEDTTYVSTIDESEEIEFSEIALGDFITAIGGFAEETNGVLNSQRIIVSSETEDSSLTVVFGNINALSSSEFLVEDFEDGEFSIDATGKVSVTKLDENGDFTKARLKEASDGEQIIIIGEMDDELVANRIHIFPIETSEE